MLTSKTKIIIGTIIFLLISPVLYWIFCWQIYQLNPNIVETKLAQYRTFSNEKLVTKLGIWNIWWFDTALDVLAERKSKEAVPAIIKLLNSPFRNRRINAMRALGNIGDKKAIEPLMKILEKGENTSDYEYSLEALSKIKYNNAFPYAIKWARRKDGYRNGAIYMIEDFERLDGIPILEELRVKIKESDPDYEYRINEAIEHIKSVNNISEEK